MLKIIVYLEAIRLAAKQLHYNAKGPNFYSDHLMMDEIQSDIGDFVDEIKENVYMRSGKQVPYEHQIYENVLKILPTEIDLKYLRSLIISCMDHIDEVSENSVKACDSDLLGKIASNLAKSLGFLNNRLA